MVGNIFGGKRHDVADKRVRIAVILDIGLAGKIVPFAGEDTFAAVRLKAHADAANPGKQVNETETARGGGRAVLLQQALQAVGEKRRAGRFPLFPAADGLDVARKKGGNLALAVKAARLEEQIVSGIHKSSGGKKGGHYALSVSRQQP